MRNFCNIFFTSVDPVKATLSISMCSEMAAPAVWPYPGTILMTPGGNPAYEQVYRESKAKF